MTSYLLSGLFWLPRLLLAPTMAIGYWNGRIITHDALIRPWSVLFFSLLSYIFCVLVLGIIMHNPNTGARMKSPRWKLAFAIYGTLTLIGIFY